MPYDPPVPEAAVLRHCYLSDLAGEAPTIIAKSSLDECPTFHRMREQVGQLEPRNVVRLVANLQFRRTENAISNGLSQIAGSMTHDLCEFRGEFGILSLSSCFDHRVADAGSFAEPERVTLSDCSHEVVIGMDRISVPSLM